MRIHVVGKITMGASVPKWFMRRDFAEHIFSAGAGYCEYNILLQCDCIACLEDLECMENGLLIYMMVMGR